MRERLGPYEIVAPLGAGGMGEVYRARDTRLNRHVAIKVLASANLGRPEARIRFEREARAIASLDHPHICTLHDVGHDDGVDFLVMQYLEGETLATRLARGPIPLDDALRYAIHIAEAIDAAHRRGVMHRDLKPSNIMLTRTGAMLLDFGLAKFRGPRGLAHELSDRSTASDLTRDGAIVGTVRYMAPEVLDGKDADARSDLFSFGALVYEMVTGRRAFEGHSEARVIAAIFADTPPPMTALRPDAPPALESAIRTCLAKDPDDRWQDARDLVRQLHWIAEGPGRTTPTPLVPPTIRTARRRRQLAFAGAIVAVGLAVATAIVLRPGRAAVAPPPHLAALPCDGATDASAARAFCDGLSEALVAKLVRLTATHPLQVTPQIGGLRRDVLTIEDARRALGATRVLQARVQPELRGFRIDYRITEPRTNTLVDAQAFTVDSAHVFDAHDRVVAWLVRVLALELTHPERETLVAHATSNAEAEVAYLTGRGHLGNRRDAAAGDSAIAQFEAAASRDARFAEARGGLGLARWAKYLRGRDPQVLERARASCVEAVDLKPQYAEGHTCLGMIAHGTRDYRTAAAALERAIDADPTYDEGPVWLGRAQEDLHSYIEAEKTYLRAVETRPQYWATHAWLANFYRRQARYEEAGRAFERAVALVPNSARGRAALAVPSIFLGHYERAIDELEQSIAIEPTREAYVNWGMTLFRMRRFDDASALIERAIAIGPRDYLMIASLARTLYWTGTAEARAKAEALYREAIQLAERELTHVSLTLPKADLHVSLADYYAKTGRAGDSRAHLEQVGLSLSDTERPTDPHQLFFAALVYTQLGDRAAALAWLERAVYWGVPAAELKAWIELDSLRDDPAFQALTRSN